MKYRECPTCGASLDFGEKCEDCMESNKRKADMHRAIKRLVLQEENGQLVFGWKELEVEETNRTKDILCG